MWNYNENDITKEVGHGGDWINKSGVYSGTIESANVINSTSSEAQGLALTIVTEQGKARLTFWYKKADGEENEYATSQLNRLMFLTKTKKENVKVLNATVDGKQKISIPVFENKEIGFFVEVKAKDDENRDYNLKDFFDSKSKKTSDEIKNGKEAQNYDYWFERFMDAEVVNIKIRSKEKAKTETEKKEEIQDEDEFPF